MYKKLFICICFSLFGLLVKAQEPQCFVLNDESGLPSNEVYSIVQDTKGFIWIGCDAGLYKFDGIRYLPYKCATQKSKSVAGLCLSSSGKIYCFNFQSQLFYLENDTLKELNHSFSNIPGIITDKKGNLFVNHIHGIASYNENSQKWKSYTGFGEDNPYKHKLFTRSVKVNKYNEVYFLNTSGIGAITEEKLSVYKNNYFIYNPPGNFIAECWKDEIWIFCVTKDLIYKYKNKETKVVNNANLKNALSGRKITNVKTLPDGILWICTYKGIVQYNPLNDSVAVLYPDYAFSNCLIDREGHYWFTTLHAGIMRIPHLDFLVWNNNKLLSNNKITKVTGDNHFIYFTTGDGQTGWLGTTTNQLTTFHSGSYADIQCLDYDKNDKCLYFYLNGSLYELKNEVIKEKYNNLIPVKSVKKVFNEYVVASSFGAFIYSFNDNRDSYQISPDWSREIIFDSLNIQLWIATNNGLLSFSNKNKKWVCKDTLFRQTQILSLDYISPSKGFYALTFDGKIYFVSQEGKYALIATLPSDIQAYKIKQYEGKIYLATNKGLWIYTQNKWTTINRLSGLASDNVQSIYIADNFIWLATGKGLQKIPVQEKTKPVASIIYLKTIKTGNNSFNAFTDVQLNYGQTLSLEPEASAYSSLGNFQYAYRIKNSESRWNYLPGNIKTISIPNIPAGDFEIELKAVDYQGNDSENIILVKGYIRPPFWKTIWFYFISITVLLAIVFFIFRQRIKALKKQQTVQIEKLNLENELRDTQQTALKAQMNPHFIFNVLNSIKGYIYENDKKNAVNYLNNFSQLVRKVLENSSKDKIPLREEIELLTTYISLETMLLQEELNFSIHIDKQLSIDDIEIPAMLLQPYVENAFKHGLRHLKGNKKLFISFESSSENTLKITIQDNGIGRNASEILNKKTNAAHQSFASSAINKRLKLLNSSISDFVKIEIIDNIEFGLQPSGTTVSITIIFNE